MTTPVPSTPLRGNSEIADLVLAVVPSLSRYLGRRLREQGAISVERFKALHALEAGPVRSNELAVTIRLSPAALTRLADGLVADHLVVRVADSTDRRAVRVALTDVGRAELARGAAIVSEALEDVLAQLSAPERRRLEAALKDLRRLLDPAQPTRRKEAQ